MLYGTDNNLQNIPQFNMNVRNILYNTISLVEQCYVMDMNNVMEK